MDFSPAEEIKKLVFSKEYHLTEKFTKFKSNVAPKYRESVEDAFAVIIEKGNEMQRFIAEEVLASEMLLNVAPVSGINASGITGVINTRKTNARID